MRARQTVERVATVNVQGGLSDAVALEALEKVAPLADIIALQEWGPNRRKVIGLFMAAHPGEWKFRKPASKCPPVLVRTRYRFVSAKAVRLARGGWVGRIVGRRSVLPDVVAGLYVLLDPSGDEVVLLNWHLPATVEAGGAYRTIESALSPRAFKHRKAKRRARRILRAEQKSADRLYAAGDGNFHLMRFRPYVSCWAGRSSLPTHGNRTIDAVFSTGPAAHVVTLRIGSDHRAVIATYEA